MSQPLPAHVEQLIKDILHMCLTAQNDGLAIMFFQVHGHVNGVEVHAIPDWPDAEHKVLFREIAYWDRPGCIQTLKQKVEDHIEALRIDKVIKLAKEVESD